MVVWEVEGLVQCTALRGAHAVWGAVGSFSRGSVGNVPTFSEVCGLVLMLF